MVVKSVIYKCDDCGHVYDCPNRVYQEAASTDGKVLSIMCLADTNCEGVYRLKIRTNYGT